MVDDYDLDKDGKLDAEEREIYLEDRRRRMEDEDAKTRCPSFTRNPTKTQTN